jgi:hypothetical protein
MKKDRETERRRDKEKEGKSGAKVTLSSQLSFPLPLRLSVLLFSSVCQRTNTSGIMLRLKDRS